MAHDDQAPTQGAGARKRKDCLPVSTRRARWQLDREQEPRCVTLRKEQEPEARKWRLPLSVKRWRCLLRKRLDPGNVT